MIHTRGIFEDAEHCDVFRIQYSTLRGLQWCQISLKLNLLSAALSNFLSTGKNDVYRKRYVKAVSTEFSNLFNITVTVMGFG